MTIRQFLFGFVLCLVSPTVFSVWLSRTWRNTQQVGGNDTIVVVERKRNAEAQSLTR